LAKEYILKHKNIPVLTFFMDEITFKLEDIGDIFSEERLPYGIIDKKNRVQNAIFLNSWIQGRGLPDSRKDKDSIKEQFQVNELKILTIQALGLNLTDHYWLHELEKDLKWEEVNHFDNVFDKIKPGNEIAPGIDESVATNSPNLCVDGSIEKRWIIKDKERYLVKGSRYRRMQEPFNEMIASRIMDLFNIYHVIYELKRTKEGIPYSECKCMCNNNIEYLSAGCIMNNKYFDTNNTHNSYIDICKNNNIKDAKECIDEMIILDFLIGNVDRHRGNYGIMRDSSTLKWISLSPIFDNGNSLFFDCENEEIDYFNVDSFSKAFRDNNRLNLQLVDCPQWYDKRKINEITDIVSSGLKENEKLKSKRIDKVVEVIRNRIKLLEGIMNDQLSRKTSSSFL
jgi:hypothetical protein